MTTLLLMLLAGLHKLLLIESLRLYCSPDHAHQRRAGLGLAGFLLLPCLLLLWVLARTFYVK